MYRLYIGNKNYSSWSLRPWLLMREQGISFEEVLIPFGDGAFEAVSPTAKVPCLKDGERPVWDSLAIIEYLADRHSGVWPADVDARAWARCAAAEMHSGFRALRDECTMNCGLRVHIATPSPALGRDIARIDELWQEGLTKFGGPYLAGSTFTAVDAFFAPVALRQQTYAFALSAPASRYAHLVRRLPALTEWYEAGLAEPYRDRAHEEEAQAAGAIIADLRASPGQ